MTRDHIVSASGCEIARRSRACALVRRACLVPDDQWAVVPRVWASRYFLLRANDGEQEAPVPLGSRPLLVAQATTTVTHKSDAGNVSECTPCTAGVPSAPESLLVARHIALGVPMGVAPFRFRVQPRVNASHLPHGSVSDYGESLAAVQAQMPRTFSC